MFGSFQFGADENSGGQRVGRAVSILGDSSDHLGSLVSHNQDGTLNLNGELICVEGALHSCPIEGHGKTPMSAITIRTFHNGKLIITQGAMAGCGAKMIRVDRKVYVE